MSLQLLDFHSLAKFARSNNPIGAILCHLSTIHRWNCCYWSFKHSSVQDIDCLNQSNFIELSHRWTLTWSSRSNLLLWSAHDMRWFINSHDLISPVTLAFLHRQRWSWCEEQLLLGATFRILQSYFKEAENLSAIFVHYKWKYRWEVDKSSKDIFHIYLSTGSYVYSISTLCLFWNRQTDKHKQIYKHTRGYQNALQKKESVEIESDKNCRTRKILFQA